MLITERKEALEISIENTSLLVGGSYIVMSDDLPMSKVVCSLSFFAS